MKHGIFILGLFVTLVSCKKNHHEHTANPAIVGKWKMTAYIRDGADVFGTLVLPCVTDNLITFTDNNQVIGDEGQTKCDPSDPQNETASYLFSNSTEFTITYNNGDVETYQIRELNYTTLQVLQLNSSDLITYTRLP